MTTQELSYWLCLAGISEIKNQRKNQIYISCFRHQPRCSIVDLFTRQETWAELGLSAEEQEGLQKGGLRFAACAQEVQELCRRGIDIVPLHSPGYPPALKKHLRTRTPVLLYTRGSLSLLQQPALSITGSREAADISLRFTAAVARYAAGSGLVVVSGYARGVDRCALDSVLEAGGCSIIVLPQGILTFAAGFRRYARFIEEGRLLVLSAFAPQAPWSASMAHARNAYIYGLADQIYIAQSGSRGGTWSGACAVLQQGRQVFIRRPLSGENNANELLIKMGAVPVDFPDPAAGGLALNF